MAQREVVTFSSRLGNKLKQMADSWTPSRGSSGSMSAGNAVGYWIMQATGDISEAVGSCATPGSSAGITPGSGTARICHRDRITGLLVPYQPNGQDVATTVYNLKIKKVKSGTYFSGMRDLDGTLWVQEIYDFCPCESSGKSVNVVTKVDFDLSNCKLVVCTRQLCLPFESSIGQEDCGGSGGSGSGSGTGPIGV